MSRSRVSSKLSAKLHTCLEGTEFMTPLFRAGALFLALLFSAEGAFAQYANPYATQNRATTSVPTDKGSKMDDLKSFATEGNRILESKTGDLTGAGHKDVLLVLDPPTTGKEKLGEGPNRTVLLLLRDASGQLVRKASNGHIVLCATCGGVSGDPFGYVRIDAGSFTIVNGGGSRERWTDEFTFTYAKDSQDWFITKVNRQVSDSETGQEKKIELTPHELGKVSFHDFDPGKVPEVTLP